MSRVTGVVGRRTSCVLFYSSSIHHCFPLSPCCSHLSFQSWSCEDPDVHQPRSVWARRGRSIRWKLLRLHGAPLPPCHGEFGVSRNVRAHLTYCRFICVPACVRFLRVRTQVQFKLSLVHISLYIKHHVTKGNCVIELTGQ